VYVLAIVRNAQAPDGETARAVSLTDQRVVVLLRGWAPFVGILVAYEVMRDLASAVGVRPYDLEWLDTTLFNGYQPTLVLQAAVARLTDADLIDDIGSIVYATHFLLPVAVAAWLWTRDRQGFRRFGLTLVILCALAFVTYVIAPTTPPWLAQPTSVRHLIEDTVQRSGLPANLVWLYSHHDYNLYAAFPSLHAGFPVVAAFAAWQRSRGIGLLLAAWALVVWVSVVYLGEHYVADVVGGIVYAMVAIAIAGIIIKSRSRRRRRLTVPPPAGSPAA
jgi:membrane-associated phospholipid phosphatase